MNTPALLGGEPAVRNPFPTWPQSGVLEAALLKQTLDSGQWWRMSGTQVKTFEREFARRHGMPYGLAVTNGTHALEAGLRTLGVGPGDEVIIPSMTFISTAIAVFMVGARPVAADVLPDTWCLDPEAVEAAFSPRTRAVIPVHFAGHTADMIRLGEVCGRRGVPVIEDAAHAHGAVYAGRPTGSFGSMSTYSFQNLKLMSAGEGGLLLLADEKLYERALLFINCGRAPEDKRYEHTVLGSNYRMSEFQAAVLNAQLTRLDTLAERRERNAAHLNNLMQDVEGVRPQGRDERVGRHSYYMYIFEYDPEAFGGLPREIFVAALCAEGVPAFRIYPRVQDVAFYASELSKLGGGAADAQECPVSARLADSGVWLHHRILLADEGTAAQVVGAIEKVRRHAPDLVEHHRSQMAEVRA